MKQFFFKFLVAGVLVICGAAHAVTCNISATSMPLSTVYAAASTQTYTGTISGSCTLEAAEAGTRPYIYIGIDEGNPPAGRAMVRQNGADLLNYQIYKQIGLTTIWNEAKAVNNGNGGISYRMTTSTGAQAFTYPYYLNIPAGQTTNPAGIYNDTAITATIRLSDNSGNPLGTINSAVFSASASIVSSCYFSTSPSSLVLNYTSFTGTAVTGNSTFALSCTFGSPYTLAIGPPATGTALGINYTLTLSAASGTGTAGPQSFGVTGTAAANQPGTCATSTCSATNPHTITVTF